jgi:hypothetical protein
MVDAYENKLKEKDCWIAKFSQLPLYALHYIRCGLPEDWIYSQGWNNDTHLRTKSTHLYWKPRGTVHILISAKCDGSNYICYEAMPNEVRKEVNEEITKLYSSLKNMLQPEIDYRQEQSLKLKTDIIEAWSSRKEKENE